MKIKLSILDLFCICVLFTMGCSNNKSNVSSCEIIKVDLVDKSNHNLSVKIESVIKLETKEDVLIGSIEKVESFDEKVYILDRQYSKTLFVFDLKGNFIAKTKLGKGPAEVINPTVFNIDRQHNKVLLWDQNLSSMFTYDLELNYIKTEKYGVLLRDFTYISKDTAFAMSYKLDENGANKKVTTYSSFSGDFSKSYGHFLPVKLDDESQITKKPISTYKRILFIKPWDYNIYEYKNNAIRPVYKGDFGRYMFSDEEMATPNHKKWDKVKSGDKLACLFDLNESENFLTFGTYFRKNIRTIIYSKLDGKSTLLNPLLKNSKLPKCEFYNVSNPEDDTFIGVVTDDKYCKDSYNDNPVLIIVKIVS